MKRALITGITGQDGSYLAELLLSLDYEVHGVVRRIALEDPEHRLGRVLHIKDKIPLRSASLESFPSLYPVFQKVRSDEYYHLAAQSFVAYSFEDEFSTLNANINGTHHVLAALRDCVPSKAFHQLGWSSQIKFPELMQEMVNEDFRLLKNEPRRFYLRRFPRFSELKV